MTLELFRAVGRIEAADARATFVRSHHARQHPHGCGLASAIGTDQSEDLTGADVEAQAVDRIDAREAAGQTRDFDCKRLIHLSSPAPRWRVAYRSRRRRASRV